MPRTHPAPPSDPHDHEVPLVDIRPPWRWRIAVAGLAVLVAVALGLLAWLLPDVGLRGPRGATGPTASPAPSVVGKPRPHPTPALTTTPTAVVILPPATPSGSRSTARPAPTRSRSARSSPAGHRPSGSPSPTPIVCATIGPASACLHRPLPLAVRPWTLQLMII